MKKLLLITLMALLLMVGVANAGCEYCSDSRLACTGDSEKQVLDKCGPPTKVVNYYNIFNQLVAVTYYYDLGEGRFTRAIHFKDGVCDGVTSFK